VQWSAVGGIEKNVRKYSSIRFTLPMETLQVPGVETESVVSAPVASTARGVTRVLLLADAPVLRRGLVSMINETAGMQSVGTPGELRRALTLVESARPDAVVVELGSGRAATLNACRDLRRRFPRVAIVALASSEDPAVVNEALAAGVRGYLMINTSPTLLGWAILAARAGRTVVDPQIRRVEPSDVPAAKPFTPEIPLTRRESDVLDELLQGQSNRQIGRNLFISEDTVKSHVKAILRKLGARDRAHAVSLVLSNRQPGCTCGHGGSAELRTAELPESEMGAAEI
jgi:DNA-binding NarL/FixJ family response regulator